MNPGIGEPGADRRKTETVLVAALTYKRPEMLETLLAGFRRITAPPSANLIFLVVDNDEACSARTSVEAASRTGIDLRYVTEPRRGIPAARNRAIDEALAIGAECLCFIDDDEYPDMHWIECLLSCREKTGAQLLGGPVEVAPATADATLWQRWINASLAARAVRRNRMTARAAATGRRYTIVTNNWLCDMAWLREAGIRFDERLLVSGGSDTAFFRSARAAGCRTDWCPRAIVHETMTPDRLTMSYQFHRAASQSMHHFAMKQRKNDLRRVVSTLAVAFLRALLGVLLLFIPVFGKASPVMAVRSMGWSFGRLKALSGGRSRLYE